ncbi:MAG: zinc-ribbon domain-containing protein, partial [Solirubrobacteraceae bacterium]
MRGQATVCPSCGTDNALGAKFCTECGSALATSCPECGQPTVPGQKFCSE